MPGYWPIVRPATNWAKTYLSPTSSPGSMQQPPSWINLISGVILIISGVVALVAGRFLGGGLGTDFLAAGASLLVSGLFVIAAVGKWIGYHHPTEEDDAAEYEGMFWDGFKKP